MTAAWGITHALELPGLGLAWYTSPAHGPVIDSADSADDITTTGGLVGIGSQLQSSLGLLDVLGRGGGVTLTLSADTASALWRAAPAPVSDATAAVSLVGDPTRYYSATTTTLDFDGELTVDTRYLIGTECIRVVSLAGSSGGVYTYNVVRGERGDSARDWPSVVLLDDGSTIPARARYRPSRVNGRHAIEPVYPDRQPADITGWPVRVWRRFGLDRAEVAYRGIVTQWSVRSSAIVVQVQSETDGMISRPIPVPEGAAVEGDEYVRSLGVTCTWFRRANNIDAEFGGKILGMSTPRQYGDALGRVVLAFPLSVTPDLPTVGDSIIVAGDGGAWYAMRVAHQYGGTPETGPRGRDRIAASNPSQWRYIGCANQGDPAELPAGCTTSIVARGMGDALLEVPNGRDHQLGRVTIVRTGGVTESEVLDPPQWWRELEDDLRREDAPKLLPDPVTIALLPRPPRYDLPIPGTTLTYAIPQRIVRGSAWVEAVETPTELCARSPVAGRAWRDVLETEMGAQALALVTAPDGSARVIDWGLPGIGGRTPVGEARLLDDPDLTYGDASRVRRVSLTTTEGARPLTIESLTQSNAEIGKHVDRDVISVRDHISPVAIAGLWGAIAALYSVSVPIASFSIRSDYDGIDAIVPGALIDLTCSTTPAPDATRGVVDLEGLVLERRTESQSQTAALTVMLLGYRPALIGPWGFGVVITTGDTGETVTLAVRELADKRGSIQRLRLLASLATVPLLYISPDGDSVIAGITLVVVASDGESVTVTSPSSEVYATGGYLTLADYDDADPFRRASAWMDRELQTVWG